MTDGSLRKNNPHDLLLSRESSKTCSTLFPKVPQLDLASIALNSFLLCHVPLISFLPFLVSLPPCVLPGIDPSNSLPDWMVGRTGSLGNGRLCTGAGGPGETMGAVEGRLVWLECFRERLWSQSQQRALRNGAWQLSLERYNDISSLLRIEVRDESGKCCPNQEFHHEN